MKSLLFNRCVRPFVLGLMLVLSFFAAEAQDIEQSKVGTAKSFKFVRRSNQGRAYNELYACKDSSIQFIADTISLPYFYGKIRVAVTVPSTCRKLIVSNPGIEYYSVRYLYDEMQTFIQITNCEVNLGGRKVERSIIQNDRKYFESGTYTMECEGLFNDITKYVMHYNAFFIRKPNIVEILVSSVEESNLQKIDDTIFKINVLSEDYTK